MTAYYSDDWLTIHEGDCREVMASMEPESVHCVVTSPPYWGLRDYGTATWLGGDEGCDHVERKMAPSVKSTLADHGDDGRSPYLDNLAGIPFKGTCGKCGAVRQDSQLGLEPTPEAYVESMVVVFREVRRVLRADGTVWLNLGDSYAGGTQTGRNDAGRPEKGRGWAEYDIQRTKVERRDGLKPKDLVGIPWRVAFALQADGWYLRSDIIWSKPNPMPESVTDRPTKAHEYLFLLSKSPRYYYDADAVREPQAEDSLAAYERAKASPREPADWKQNTAVAHIGAGATVSPNAAWSDPEKLDRLLSRGRNLRSVWSVATQPYPGAHFATFPEKLVEPCILAGTSAKGVCPECGVPWVRETSVDYERLATRRPTAKRLNTNGALGVRPTTDFTANKLVTTTGWRRGCVHHGAPENHQLRPPVPATVLDPFAGSGTTARVAARLSRRAVLIDLNADYLRQAMKRNTDIPLGMETA